MRSATKRNHKNKPKGNSRAEEHNALKNSTDSFTSRLYQAKERISEHEDRSTEITQSEERKGKEKKMKKRAKSLEELWDT